MKKEKELPNILNDIIEFFKFWDNPNDEKGEYKSIQRFQLAIYDPSFNFIFKWIIPNDELIQVSEYTEIEIINNTIQFSLAEYNIELQSQNSTMVQEPQQGD